MPVNVPDKIVLHCAATPDYPLSKSLPKDFGAKDIDQWHREKGWTEIGYHAVIKRGGQIEYGTREESEYGAHVRGHNINSLGICYVGTELPTIPQIASIIYLYKLYFNKYGIKHDRWFGHREFDEKKDCPGFSMDTFRSILKLIPIDKGEVA